MPLTNDELTDTYADIRRRCIAIGRALTDEESAALTPCCPEWSAKDTIAHLAGITSDILSGNTEDAATAPWADAQVAARRDRSMEEVCAEWEANAPAIDELLRSVANDIDPRFFVDAWTHEWDLRQATGSAATPDMRAIDHVWDWISAVIGEVTGTALPASVMDDPAMSRFELARIIMGRRSRRQIEALGLVPGEVVAWTPNDKDIVDPVLP